MESLCCKLSCFLFVPKLLFNCGHDWCFVKFVCIIIIILLFLFLLWTKSLLAWWTPCRLVSCYEVSEDMVREGCSFRERYFFRGGRWSCEGMSSRNGYWSCEGIWSCEGLPFCDAIRSRKGLFARGSVLTREGVFFREDACPRKRVLPHGSEMNLCCLWAVSRDEPSLHDRVLRHDESSFAADLKPVFSSTRGSNERSHGCKLVKVLENHIRKLIISIEQKGRW